MGIFEDIIMNHPAPTHLIVTRDHGETNRKLLAKEGPADLTRVESASRKVNITLASPEGKRLYLRCFYVSQANFHFISVFGRMKLPAEDVDQVEQELRTMLDARIALPTSVSSLSRNCAINMASPNWPAMTSNLSPLRPKSFPCSAGDYWN
jgi:hypothetical protein